ncbi:hypothetical protein CALCODRAFT_504263 [Calocera cornea HHB12733]|uniref:Uncharacterized protein n=1 Tax=Calocera cornea HHB12733 TaxID=1353952 RepID=A0A165CI36_9BASI|nr:hypothetical protein CALCODRAFT_504263 [Calocera cornea HHB12733]
MGSSTSSSHQQAMSPPTQASDAVATRAVSQGGAASVAPTSLAVAVMVAVPPCSSSHAFSCTFNLAASSSLSLCISFSLINRCTSHPSNRSGLTSHSHRPTTSAQHSKPRG